MLGAMIREPGDRLERVALARLRDWLGAETFRLSDVSGRGRFGCEGFARARHSLSPSRIAAGPRHSLRREGLEYNEQNYTAGERDCIVLTRDYDC